jgi:hypothetical protein
MRRRRADVMAFRAMHARVVARCLALLAVAAVGIPLLAALPAPAGAKSFSVPKCSWATSKEVSKTLGESVRSLAGVWTTVTAPVLTCAYVERQPLLQASKAPILQIRFAETQRVKPRSRSKRVKKLGHCQGSSCPVNGAAALLSVTYTRKPAIYAFRYISGIDLRVQDGLNAIEIVLATPDGPLPVRDAVARIENLMRRLLPKFEQR